MELQTENAPAAKSGQLLTPTDYNTARAADLNVNWPAESVFNNAVARFAAAVREPLLARIEVLSGSVRASMTEIDRLKLENAELRQVRDSGAHIAIIRLPAAPVIDLRPAVKFCNQCGKVFAVGHADCRGHVPPEFAAPRCPQGMTEHWYCAGPGVQLVCHLDIDLGEAATESDPAWPAKAELRAAYLNGVNVLDALLSAGHIALIEEEALIEVQS